MGLLLFGIKSVLQSMVPGFIVGGAAVVTTIVGNGVHKEIQKRKAAQPKKQEQNQ